MGNRLVQFSFRGSNVGTNARHLSGNLADLGGRCLFDSADLAFHLFSHSSLLIGQLAGELFGAFRCVDFRLPGGLAGLLLRLRQLDLEVLDISPRRGAADIASLADATHLCYEGILHFGQLLSKVVDLHIQIDICRNQRNNRSE